MSTMSGRARAREIRQQIAASTSEAELQGTICDVLELRGWRWHHETDSRRSNAGWPDLFAVNPETGWWLALELKGSTTAVTQAQLDWLKELCGPSGAAERLEKGWLWTHGTARKLVGLIYPVDLDRCLQAIADHS